MSSQAKMMIRLQTKSTTTKLMMQKYQIISDSIMKPVRSLYKNPLEAAAERKERERNEKQQELEVYINFYKFHSFM